MVLIFNDIAGSEIFLILVFVLIFFGSKSIPGLAKTLGRTIRQVKDASADIQNEIKKSGAEMKKDLNLTGILEETAEDIRRPLDQHVQDLDNAIKYQPPKVQSHIKPEVVSVADSKNSALPVEEKETDKPADPLKEKKAEDSTSES